MQFPPVSSYYTFLWFKYSSKHIFLKHPLKNGVQIVLLVKNLNRPTKPNVW
jgi:hypothetical protein